MPQFSITTLSQQKFFDLRTSLALAEASAHAYLEEEGIRAQYPEVEGFTRLDFFDYGETQGFMTSTGEVAVLAFRGTEQKLSDWLRNLRVLPTEDALGSVHRGFSGALDMVWPELRVLCDTHEVEKKRFWLTGHSLGAAIAAVCGSRLHVAGIKVAGFHTFGQPMLATKGFQVAFDDIYREKYFRFINQSDIVTRIPPGYRHVGTPKRITREGTLEIELAGAMASFAPEEAAEGQLLESDHAPLTEEQYDLLLNYVEAVPEVANAKIPDLDAPEMEGVLPWVSDHAITEYVRHLQELIQAHPA